MGKPADSRSLLTTSDFSKIEAGRKSTGSSLPMLRKLSRRFSELTNTSSGTLGLKSQRVSIKVSRWSRLTQKPSLRQW